MYERYGKRLLDIILSLAATIILAIPMGLVALWIKLDSPGPVFQAAPRRQGQNAL